ncbi:MAG: hypothetical protein M1822_007438 [Bathelium mastoideum]|nr:MAG: hypothetical protein M1822_007438 [Bathelium mastoideum]
MNALVRDAVDAAVINKAAIVRDTNTLTRQKMAMGGTGPASPHTNLLANGAASLPVHGFSAGDFGIHPADLAESELDGGDAEDGDEDEEESDVGDGAGGGADPIAAERKRRLRRQDHLRRSAGEPVKPPVEEELGLLHSRFLDRLRRVLTE